MRMHSKSLDMRIVKYVPFEQKNQMMPAAITSYKYYSAVYILSASKSAAKELVPVKWKAKVGAGAAD